MIQQLSKETSIQRILWSIPNAAINIKYVIINNNLSPEDGSTTNSWNLMKTTDSVQHNCSVMN